MDHRSCDIIIPVYNKRDMTKDCLESIRANTRTPYRIILVDNASAAETKDFLESVRSSHDNIVLLRNNENAGWVKAVNQGMRASNAPYVCIMNNDTIVRTPDWLSKMIDAAEMSPDTGIVNPCFEMKRCVCCSGPVIEIDFARGYCMLVKRQVVDNIGLFDEVYGLGYYDDDDFSVRAIRAGFRCVRASNVYVEHIGGSTFAEIFADEKKRELHEKNKNIFYSKWGRRLNIVLVLTSGCDKEKAARAMLSLARRQHIVYLWNSSGTIGAEHINIRESSIPGGYLGRAVVLMKLYNNKMKKKEKRYAAVFTDDNRIASLAARLGFSVSITDMSDSGAKALKIADTLSGAFK